jgi:ribosomal RNA assembly protein
MSYRDEIMQKNIKIPEIRIPVLLSCKSEIENEAGVRLVVDREANEINIDGEAMDVMTAENIVMAIGRGFAPEKAMKLIDEEYSLSLIHLPKDDRTLNRMRSRIIGEQGTARKTMEELSMCDISVFGKTVGIIGKYECADNAMQAIEQLMNGFSHRSVYAFLEKKRKEMKIVKD